MTEEDPELQRIREEKMRELQEGAFGSGNWPSEPVSLTDAAFDDFISKYPLAVVDCWAPWCGPCRMVAPIVEELAKEYKGRIAFGKLNTDENHTIAMRFQIMSIPTLLVFKDGSLVDRIIGAMPKSILISRLKKHL